MINKLRTSIANHPGWQEKFWQLFRFGIVGTICSGIHYGIYCMILLIANYNIAYTGGYLVGLVCNYGLTTFFTFKDKPSSKNVIGFGFSHLINYLLEIFLLNLFLWVGFSKWLSPILVMIIVVPINFLILHFVYKFSRRK